MCISNVGKKLSSVVRRFIKDERAVTAIEYGVIGVCMAVMLAVVFSSDGTLNDALNDAMDKISASIAAIS